MADRGYALDLLWPVRHVVTELVAADGAGLTPEEIARTFDPFLPDLGRIRHNEGCKTDTEAKHWLMQTALDVLGKSVTDTGTEGRYRLAVPIEKVKWGRRRIHPIPRGAEADAINAEHQIRIAYGRLKTGAAFSVQVESARGSVKERRLKQHPLSLLFPLMPEKEFVNLVDDVRENGIQVPIHVLDDEILDGRHRAAVAVAIDVPIRVAEFTGSEDDARRLVISTNLKRRHLTTVQRTVLAEELFMDDAKKVAAESHREASDRGRDSRWGTAPPAVPQPPEGGRGGKSTAPPAVDHPEAEASPPPPATKPKKRGKTAAQIAAEMSDGMATARNIEMVAPVKDAPKTRAKVMAGEIKTVPAARREALKETGRDEPENVGTEDFGDWDSLGRSLYWLKRALKSRADGSATGKPRSAGEYSDRLDEITALIDEFRGAL
jgi:hypothetical protein